LFSCTSCIPPEYKEHYEEEDIKGTIDMSRLWRMDSSSSDDSTEDEPPIPSENDKKFMEEALKVAKFSPDPHKQVRDSPQYMCTTKVNSHTYSAVYVHVGGSSCGGYQNKEDPWTWVE
jgi:hypothetical protein